jgi:2',3'-cyclic-nucleotide 2'-phosphodiesterase (5'-nucleotidase family)
VKTYGDRRIGFVGVCTPSSLETEAYAFFDENGQNLYNLRPDDVVALVQHAVDSVRRAGADYVVLLSHLGEAKYGGFIDSHTLIGSLTGVDAVLDGHTHSVVPCDRVPDLNKRPIPVTQTGTQFAHIGKLLITADGRISTSLIPINNIPYSSPSVTAAVDSVKGLMDAITGEVIGRSDFELTAADSRGDWLVRKGETNLGDLCADAFRERFGADIGLVNGGGIRNSIPAGRITFGDAVNAIPYYDLMCKIEVSGETLLNMLKQCTERYPQADGSFPQVSGLRFTLHASDHSVTDVRVMNRTTAQYEPLQPGRSYTVAVSDYYRSGFGGALKNTESIERTTDIAYTVLSRYIQETLGGDVSAYRTPQGRIVITE